MAANLGFQTIRAMTPFYPGSPFPIFRSIARPTLLLATFVAALLATAPVLAQVPIGALERWVTYNGGIGSDAVLSVATDAFGHVYVAGRTSDSLLLGNDTTDRSGFTYQRHYGGGSSDAFLAKVAPQGSVLWCTYFGGPGDDEAVQVVVVDMEGVYVVGNTTSLDSIATDTMAFQSSHGGGSDIFIARFTEYGALTGATYYGSTGDERASGATLDPTGHLVVCGTADAPNASVPDSLWQQQPAGGTDGLVLRFNGTEHLVAGTFYGGEGNDELVQVVADSTGLMLFGTTSSASGIATADAFSPALNGPSDAFLLKMNSDLAVQRATYFGGEGEELAKALVLKGDSLVIGGATWSDTLYTDSTALQTMNMGNGDGFLAVLDTSFQLRWATFLGDTTPNAVQAIAIDHWGRIYVAASAAMDTTGLDLDSLVTTTPSYIKLMRLDTGMQMAWARGFGGFGNDQAHCLVVKGHTALFLGGSTTSQQIVHNGHQMNYGGGPDDGFTGRLDQQYSTVATGICQGGRGGPGDYDHISPPRPELHLCRGDSAMLIVFGGALGSASEWMWYADSCGVPEYFLTSGDTIVIKPDHNFQLAVRAEGLDDVTSCRSIWVIVHEWPEPVAVLPDSICAGAPLALSANGAERYAWFHGDSLLATIGDTLITAPMEPGPWPLRLVGTNGPSCSGTVLDTVWVNSLPAIAWHTQAVTCLGDIDGAISFVPDTANTHGLQFLWADSALQGPVLHGLLAGSYPVGVTDTVTGCTVRDTLLITDPAPLMDSLSVTDAACGGLTGAAQVHTSSSSAGLMFDLGGGPVPGTAFSALPPGAYTITASNTAGCHETRSFTITAYGMISVAVAADTVLAQDGIGQIGCTISPPDSLATFQWSPATGLADPHAANTAFLVTDTTLYVIIATSYAGCKATDSVLVIPWKEVPPASAVPCGDFLLPDNFSPNGDGLNDELCPLGGCFTNLEWRVYDPWGALIYISSDPAACWDGARNGVALPKGSYPFTFTAERSNGEQIERRGLIHLQR